MTVASRVTAWLKRAWGWLRTRSWWVLLLIGAVLLLVLGCLVPGLLGRVNIGGIFGRLFGRKAPSSAVEVANTVPKERKDAQGMPIPVGQPDERGYTQWEVREVERRSNPFRDKSKIRVVTTDPEKPEAKPVVREVELPTGIRDTDVATVVEVQPQVFVVAVKDKSGIRASDVLKELP